MRSAPWLLLLLAFPALSAEPAGLREEIDGATAMLSRYPLGQVPVDPYVIGAIGTLADAGGREEVPILRSLVEHERAEIQDAAGAAIQAIRERQRESQRTAFAQELPDWPDLSRESGPLRARGLGREEAACAAYARFVLGEHDPAAAAAHGKVDGHAPSLLASGAPRRALGAIDGASVESGLLAAKAREDLGDVPGAVRIYATLAAGGVPDARRALDGYGVDVERLLLGMLVDGERPLDAVEPGPPPLRTDAQVLEVLVRHGGNLTVAVLAERTRHGTPSEGATAADALARMLDPSLRAEPLPVGVEREARHALRLATTLAPAPVAQIASEALAVER